MAARRVLRLPAAVAAFALEVVEKAADQVGIEIGQVEIGRIFAGLGLGVGE